MTDDNGFLKLHEVFHPILEELRRAYTPLYHHTKSLEVAESIAAGMFWFTRADCFSDASEITYGKEVFLEALEERKEHGGRPENQQIIQSIAESLRSSYILSLTDVANQQHLIDHYGAHVVQIDSHCMRWLHPAWLYHPLEDGSGTRTYLLNDIFRRFDGYVVYDRVTQLARANRVLNAVDALRRHRYVDETVRAVELMELNRVICANILFFKNEQYQAEQEYRVCLLRSPNPGFENAPAFAFPHPVARLPNGVDKMMLAVDYRARDAEQLKIV